MCERSSGGYDGCVGLWSTFRRRAYMMKNLGSLQVVLPVLYFLIWLKYLSSLLFLYCQWQKKVIQLRHILKSRYTMMFSQINSYRRKSSSCLLLQRLNTTTINAEDIGGKGHEMRDQNFSPHFLIYECVNMTLQVMGHPIFCIFLACNKCIKCTLLW